MRRQSSTTELEGESTLHLIAAAHSGRSEAVEILCRRYIPRVRAWIRGRLPQGPGMVDDTDDVAQESLLFVLRRLETFDPEHSGAFLAFVRRTVQNKLNDRYRQRWRRPAGELPSEIPDFRPSPLATLLSEERVRAYEEALEKLEAVDRSLVFTRFELRLSYEQIAREFGKSSPDAARMAVKRAVARLAENMRSGANA